MRKYGVVLADRGNGEPAQHVLVNLQSACGRAGQRCLQHVFFMSLHSPSASADQRNFELCWQ